MNKKEKLRRFYCLVLLLFIFVSKTTAQVILENDRIKLLSDGKHIVSLYDKVRKIEHISTDYTVANGLFGVSYLDTVTYTVVGTVNSNQFASVSTTKVGNDEATFLYDNSIMTATVGVKLKPNEAEVAWTISLKLKNSAYAFSQVDFPRFRTPQSYGGAVKKFIDSSSEGRVYPLNQLWSPFTRYYPSGQALQLSGCISKDAGIAIWCNDTKVNIKSFGYLTSGTSSHLGVRHLMPYGNLQPGQGQNWETEYETMLSLCGNSWQDAAEIYRNWAILQEWSATPFRNRKDISPKFHLPALALHSNGSTEFFNTLPATLQLWADKFDANIIYRPTYWEKYGIWGGIDYFPSGLGDQNFINLNNQLKLKGYTTLTFIEGYHWLTSLDGATPEINAQILASYNKYNGNANSRTMVDGKPYVGKDSNRNVVYLCRGTELGKTFLQGVAKGLFDLGVTMLENDYDQLIGGEGQCFNKAHGHPIPYGKWETALMQKVYKEITVEAKNRNITDFSLSKEWPCEVYNMSLQGYVARGWRIVSSQKDSSIPLFAYVYHEYIPCVFGFTMGNEKNSAELASSIILGEIPSIGFWNGYIRPPYPGPNSENILKDYHATMKTHSKGYLLYGKMLKPIVLSSNSILHNTWQDSNGNIGVFAIDTLETNSNINMKVPGTSIKYMSVYTGATLISTKQVKGGDPVMLEIPKWRLCAAIFTEYPLSVKSLIEKNPIKLHPNPVTTILNIETTIDIQHMEVNIFDSTGKSMGKFNKNTIDFQNFDSGVYIISIKSNNHLSFHKVIKQSIN